MKINKFNEKLKSEYYSCMIMQDSQIVFSNIFETEQDMDYWLINLANTELSSDYSAQSNYKRNPTENVIIENENFLIIDVTEAINYFQEYLDWNVHYSSSDMYRNVKLKYDVELFINSKKFNI